MSQGLADLLNGYSSEISARVQHNEDVAQDNADRKATTLQERFEHAQNVIEGVGTELTSIGGAYHIGRKLYKKYKAKYGNQKAEDPASNDAPQDPPADDGEGEGEGGEGGEGAGDEDRTGGQGEEGSSTGGQNNPTDSEGGDANRVENPDEEAQASAEAPTDEPVGDAPAPAEAPAPAPAEAPAPAFDVGSAESQARRSAIADDLAQRPEIGDVEGNIGVGDRFGDDIIQQARARAQEATQGAIEELRQPEPQVDAPPEDDAPSGDAPHGTTQTGEDSSDAVRQGAGDAEEEAVQGAEQGANEGSTLTSDLTGQLRRTAINEADSGAGNILKNIGTKVASKVGGALGDVGGLATTEGVLDALGPVGEVAGAVVGLVSLFENLFHKPEEPKQGTGAVQTQVGGIDPTALAQKVPVVGEVI